MQTQKTLKQAVVFKDIGLHLGTSVEMKVNPAPANHGIVFQLTHKGGRTLAVELGMAQGVGRGTNLSDGEFSLHTIEHFMAAVGASGLSNLLVEIDADEPPIMDGSALAFIEEFERVGFVDQAAPVPVWRVVKPCVVEHEGSILMAFPDDHFSISYTLDYRGTFIGIQHLDVNLSTVNLKDHLLRARTFCLLHEVEGLKARGQALGGSLKNAIVVDGNRCVNPEGLRFEQEFAWHKILDFYGDTSILRGPIHGRFVGIRSGHRQNIGLMKKLIEEKAVIMDNPWANKKVLELEDIKRVIPHRYPFLLVDRITSLVVGESAIGIKNVTGNEEFFNGHFPDTPVMPGVLIVEALAQVAGVCLLSMTNNQGKTPFFMGLEQVKFRKPVFPGDQLELSIQVLKLRGNTGKVEARASVAGQVHVEGNLSFFIK